MEDSSKDVWGQEENIQKTGSRKGLWKNLLSLFIVTVIFFVSFEVILRIADSGKPPQELKFVAHSSYNPFLIFGPNINRTFEQKKSEPIYFNSQGFRMKEDLPFNKAPNEYRVFALGGSATENIPNEENLHYCGEANKILEDVKFGKKKFHCINTAKSAYTSAHSLVRLQFDLLAFNPDMITVMHNINDLAVNFFPSDERTNYANRYLYEHYALTAKFTLGTYLKNSFLRNSRILIFLYQKVNNIKENFKNRKLYDEEGKVVVNTMRFNPARTELKFKDEFKNNLIAMARIAKAHNITLVLMSQPAIFEEDKIIQAFGQKAYNNYILYPEYEEFKESFEEYNRVIKEVAENEDIPFIDMNKLMEDNESYFADMAHYTPEGIRKFGSIYANSLRKVIEGELV